MSRAQWFDPSTLLGIVAIVLWSATVALARSIAERVGPLTAGAVVYLAAGGFLGLHLFARERSFQALRRLPGRYVLGCGGLFVFYTLALFLALGRAADRGQAIEIGLLNYLWPTLTILFALILLGQRAGMGLIPGTALALCGIFLVLTQGADVTWTSFVTNLRENPLAYGLGACAAVAWGLYSNLTRRWGGSDGRGAVLVFTLATGMAFGVGRLLRPEPGMWDLRVASEVALLALSTALAYVCWDLAMRAGDVVLVASCSYLTPFLSTVVSCLYLQVRPGLGLWAGCALIIAGSFLSWKSIRPATEPTL
jgi:drug/metabolite transporter (DMT)-like permease